MKFSVNVGNSMLGPFSSFLEAFKKFYEEIGAMIAGGTSARILETMCWMECDGHGLLFFLDVRDLAYKFGVLTFGGALVDGVEISDEKIAEEFDRLFLGYQTDEVKNMKALLATLSANVKKLPPNMIAHKIAGLLNEVEIILKKEKTGSDNETI